MTTRLLPSGGSFNPVCHSKQTAILRRLFALAREPKQFVRFPGGGHDNLDDYGAIETARRFINAAKS